MITEKHRFKRLDAADKVELAVQALHDFIVHGDLRPGTELPPESEMAKQLGVSKFSMREALRIAQAQGLVEIAQGRRTKVAEVSIKPVTGMMDIIFRRSGNALLELTEARKCLECAIIRFAALRIQPEQITALQNTISALRDNQHNLEYCIRQDIEFHHILLEAGRNRVFEIMLAPLTELLKRSRLHTLSTSGVQKAIDEHTELLHALMQRDPDTAEQAMSKHLQTAEENLKASGESP
ncbi:MAG: FadR family transcriptional regulator [bacterium]|nr:FadR family transcriptional regulator [bacterium]